MQNPFSAAICHINLGAIQRNFHRLGKPQNLMPVVKSDAYGHGLEQVAQALIETGASQFAVGLAEEGRILRGMGFSGQIVLLLGCLNESDWNIALEYNLTPVIGSFEDIEKAISKAANSADTIIQAALKCDTGMNRLGFKLENIARACELLVSNSAVKPVLLLSHLACADMPEEKEFTENQFNIFDKFAKTVRNYFPQIKCSLGNSAGTLHNPAYEVLRPGLALYGYSPFPEESALEPAMSVSAPIIHIRDVPAGQSLSYGRLFKTDAPARIAVTACGYASGLLRSLSGRFSMLVNGKRVPQRGRICMGMSMIDITGVPETRIGDMAWIIGGEPVSGEKAVNAQELADIAQTIPYEPLCMFGSLNSRVYDNY